MAWKTFPIPSNIKPSKAMIAFHDTPNKRSVVISREAIAQTGLNGKDRLTMEFDEDRPELIRIRRCKEDEAEFGRLSMPRNERSGRFATGGRVLFEAGYAAGSVEVACGPGWVSFDASPLRPAPWPLKISPNKALGILRGLVADQVFKKIIDEIDVDGDDVNAVKRMVGESKVTALKSQKEPEREKEFTRLQSRWSAAPGAGASKR